MSAPQIPNLLESLRKSKQAGASGTSGVRGDRRRTPGGNSGPSSDAVIQQTDEDAAGSRLSAVDVGYLDDPYARALASSKLSVRRMPIINRGTYVRTVAIDALVLQFLGDHQTENVQIISLGAGTDTRPFRVLEKHPDLAKRLVYHEIDFADCTRNKVTAIINAGLLKAYSPQASNDGTELTSDVYSLHAVDLRTLASDSVATGERVALPGVNPQRLTLILSECCLTYLTSSTVVSLLQRLISDVLSPTTPVSLVLYEPLHPDDAFGKTMVLNLSMRGISLPGLQACPTVLAHQQRLRQCGFETTGGMLVKDWWRSEVLSSEKERLQSLEGLDEEEEWELLAAHYGFLWASRGFDGWPSI